MTPIKLIRDKDGNLWNERMDRVYCGEALKVMELVIKHSKEKR